MGPTKVTIQYECQACHDVFPRWQGQCQSCEAWNTLEPIETTRSATKHRLSVEIKKAPVALNSVQEHEEDYLPTGIQELDTVLGKGFVRDSVVLLGGEPGIGKSTLALQFAQRLAANGLKVLYISGEESINQVLLRARRVGEIPESLYVLSEVNVLSIIESLKAMKPDMVILDSVQVLYHPQIPSAAGSVNQVRHCASELIRAMKTIHVTALFIGHINKEGALAGPKVLEHLVDVILYMEGERNQHYRLLRSFKNRYAPTNELGVFEMKQEGLIGVPSPSSMFIDESTLTHPGSMVSAISEGSRVMLVEVQSLVVETGYGMAKRTFLGVDPNRANVLIAAMEKLLGFRLGNKDIILTIVGGLKIHEPALDLAMMLAMVSSISEKPMPVKMAAIGEVGLTGEVRAIPHAENRLIECEKMGFDCCMLPAKNKIENWSGRMKLVYVETISEAIDRYLKG